MRRRTPLDDVAYLAGSSYRVKVLQALADEAQTRPTLHDRTEVPQPTLGRLLGEFEKRGWIRKAGRRYRITALGALVAADFGALLEAVAAVQSLASVAGSLPLEEMDFDPRLLGDARVTTPRSPDVFAHFRRGEELVRDAAAVRTLVSTFALETLPKQREWILEGGQREEVIMTADAFDQFISHPEAVETTREVLSSGRMTVYRYDGEVPVGLTVADNMAVIVPYDEQNVPVALVETTDETVHAWVTARLDEYREAATAVTVADLP
jgi:predicted transcriptional regulator